jgi:hypothetical protein
VKLHGNAKLTPVQRRLWCARVVDERWTVAEAADAARISERRAYEWLRRWRAGDRRLEDRSSPLLALTVVGGAAPRGWGGYCESTRPAMSPPSVPRPAAHPSRILGRGDGGGVNLAVDPWCRVIAPWCNARSSVGVQAL